jgi:hypothetical protein
MRSLVHNCLYLEFRTVLGYNLEFPVCARAGQFSARSQKKKGEIPHFHMELDKLADNYGELAAIGKAYIDTISSDSSDTSRLHAWLQTEKKDRKKIQSYKVGFMRSVGCTVRMRHLNTSCYCALQDQALQSELSRRTSGKKTTNEQSSPVLSSNRRSTRVTTADVTAKKVRLHYFIHMSFSC